MRMLISGNGKSILDVHIKKQIMKNNIIVVLVSFWSFMTVAQQSNANTDLWDGKSSFNVTVLGYHRLPKAIDFKGNFLQALTWIDAKGENLLILARNGFYEYPYNKNCKGPEEKTCFGGELYAYLFIKTEKGYQKQWRVFDYLDQWSGGDFHINFINQSLSITDLDQDQVAEVSFAYDYACRYDVSPATMKIIAYEGDQKYALRGKTIYGQMGQKNNYKADSALKEYPALKSFLVKKWNAFVDEAKR